MAARVILVLAARASHISDTSIRTASMTLLGVTPALAESVEQEPKCWLVMMAIFVPMMRVFQGRDVPPRPMRMHVMMAMLVRRPMGV